MMATKFFVLAMLLVGVNCFSHQRVRRQVQGAGSTNPDGTYNFNAKVPLVGNDKNVLSAIGSINGLDNHKGTYGAAGGGLALDNV